MELDAYFAELDRVWRRRVIAFGRRGLGRRLSEDDLDECFNSTLVRWWRRGHRHPVEQAGGLMCEMMKSVCADRLEYLSAQRRALARTVALGRSERVKGTRVRRRVPLFDEVCTASGVLSGADQRTLDVLAAVLEGTSLEDAYLPQVATEFGITYGAVAQRMSRIRRDLATELPQWRGPDGEPVDGKVHARGRTRTAEIEYNRRRGVAAQR